jgi:protein O-mannosyl-transferase
MKLDSKRALWTLWMVLIVAAYFNTIHSPFVYDDKIEVIGNSTIRFLEEWKAIAGYNPARLLLQFSYAANFHRSGLEPLEYHVVNIAIHCLAAGAALFMADAVGRLARHPFPLAAAGAAAGAWALHPMCTESVTYTTGRSESLCALFCFLAMGCWAQGLQGERDGTGGSRWRGLGLLMAICAGLTKEVGLMAPFAALAMEVLLSEKPVRRGWYIPLAGLLVAGAGFRLYSVEGAAAEGASTWALLQAMLPREAERSTAVQLSTQAEAWLRYVALWALPLGQTIYHHLPDSEPLTLRGALPAIAWFGMAAGAWRGCRESPASRFALCAGALFLLPSSSFAPLKESMAEHRAHQLGLYLLLAVCWLKPDIWKGRMRWLLLACLPLAIWTHQRNTIWQSEVSIWEEAVAHNPQIGEAWYGLGDALRFADRHPEAEDAFKACVERDPNYLDGWNNLGIVRAQLGKDSGAEEAWKEALLRSQDYCKAHNNLGLLASRKGKWDDALSEFHAAVRDCPENAIAHYGLGSIYYGPRRNKKRAIRHYQILLEISPTFDRAEEARGRLLELTW